MRRTWRAAVASLATLAVAVGLIGTAGPTAAATTAWSRVALGAYASGFPGTGSQVRQFEGLLARHLAIASSFRGWGDVFPDAAQREDAAGNHTLLVAWDLGATAATRFATFPAHRHDGYLSQEAAAAAAFGKPLYVRPWAEMNADWSPFQADATGSRPAGGTYAEFVAAWRYVVTFFRQHGATNVRWVFNPTTDTYAETTDVRRIWPGAAYVDVLGLDGYNWGTGGVLHWRSFASVYATQYQRLVSLAPTRPVWVCEFGSKEPAVDDGAPADRAHSKAQWYADLGNYLQSATHISAVVMFEVRKERDWRVESSAAALSTVRSIALGAATRLP